MLARSSGRWFVTTGLFALSIGCAAGDEAPPPVADAATPRDVASTARDAAATDARVDAAAPDVSAPPDVASAPDASVADDLGDLTPDMTPDGAVPRPDAEPPMPVMGATMRVTATSLNLRSGPGTTNAIVTSMPCGATVTVLGGPTSGWWNIRFNATTTGWASGAYLVAAASFDASICGGGTTTPPVMTGAAPEVSRIFELARSAVGYSYYWGHGSWGTDGLDHGSCSGSCPSCSHTGRYGADCSGFVAKVWQIPAASPVTTDAHPYSTYDFVNSTRHWTRVDRAMTRPGDAMVYNSGGSGHIFLVESGSDPWGSVWAFEARGCATGVVHNLRSAPTNYTTIRREGL